MFYFVFNKSCFFLKFPKGRVRYIKTKFITNLVVFEKNYTLRYYGQQFFFVLKKNSLLDLNKRSTKSKPRFGCHKDVLQVQSIRNEDS